MVSDIWLRTILIVRKETQCRHMGYSFRLTARVLLYASSHRQDNTYHSLCYTSRGALAGTRNSSIIFINAYCSVGNMFMRKTWWISKGSFICTIPQTGQHIPRPVWSTTPARRTLICLAVSHIVSDSDSRLSWCILFKLRRSVRSSAVFRLMASMHAFISLETTTLWSGEHTGRSDIPETEHTGRSDIAETEHKTGYQTYLKQNIPGDQTYLKQNISGYQTYLKQNILGYQTYLKQNIPGYQTYLKQNIPGYQTYLKRNIKHLW